MSKTLTRVRRRTRESVEMLAFGLARRTLWWWPLGLLDATPRPQAHRPQRIGYYHHAFPLPSETFVQREVLALRRQGLSLRVYSHHPADTRHLGEEALRLRQDTVYLEPHDPARFEAYRRRYRQRDPLLALHHFLYVFGRQHRADKILRRDRDLWRRVIYLAGTLEDDDINHVHVPWANPDALVAMLASRLLRIPYTVQGRASDLHRHATRPGVRERLRHATCVLTNTDFNVAAIDAILAGAANPPPIARIYNGLDLSALTPIPAPRPQPTPVVLAVGRLIEAKGFEYLLEACGILSNRGVDFRCEIVGEAPEGDETYLQRLLERTRRLGLQERVRFLGGMPVDAVFERYREATVFCLPSIVTADGVGDVTPNVVLEAMAMACPVVSTRSRGIPELVEDNVSGVLVSPRDATALAAALQGLLADPDRRRRLGEAARARVEERFDISKNAATMAAIFRAVHEGRIREACA